MKRVGFLFLVLIFVLIPSFEASGRSGSDPLQWFSIAEIKLNTPSGLPDELDVSFSTSSRSISFKHGGDKPVYVQIDNASVTLDSRVTGYDGNKKEYRNNSDIPDALEYPWIPKYKIVNNNLYIFQDHEDLTGSQKEKNQFHPSEINKRQKSNGVGVALVDFFPELEGVMKEGRDRPKKVEAPDPMKLESDRILYDGNFYNFTATVEFKLNENYNPNALQHKPPPTRHFPRNHDSFWIEFLAGILGSLENMWERVF
jgi:hypothetical protein